MKVNVQTNSKRKIIALVLLPAFLIYGNIAGAIAGTSDELREEFHQTYPLSAEGRVALHNVSGTVRITGWDRNEVRVDAVKRAERRERLSEAEIKVESTADSIRIWTKYPDDNVTISSKKDRSNDWASVDYTLTLPRTARLDSIALVSGSLEITGITGDVRASTVSGKLKASGLAGEARLSTVSGTLDATFDRLTETKPITLSSVNGAILMTLPSDSQAQLRANTLSGPITSDFGLDAQQTGYVGHQLYGQLGKGGVSIRLHSVNGSIGIRHANDSKPLSPATSLSSKKETDPSVQKVKTRRVQSEAVTKARQKMIEARETLRQAQRKAATSERAQPNRSVIEAQRSVDQALAQLQRTQSQANSEAQRAAIQALAEAQSKLRVASAELARTKTETNSETARQQAQALAEAQRQMAQAEADLQRVIREEVARNSSENAIEVVKAHNELIRVQREMQQRAVRDLREKKVLQTEEQIKAREVAREKMRAQVRATNIGGLKFNNTESKSFSVSAKPRVTIGTFDGRITIHAWDKNEVTYTATKRTFEENTLKGISLKAEQNGSDVSIQASLGDAYVHRVAGVKSVNAYTSIEVYVPRNAIIHASTSEGGMIVDGVTGEVDLRNSAGSITVNNCKGRLSINGGSGRVSVNDFDGELDARASNGGLHLGGHFTRLSAQTNNEPITLAVSPDTNAVIEADAAYVSNEGLQTSEEGGSSQRVKRFKVGKGGPVFTLRAGESRIYLRPTGRGPM